MFQLFFSIFAFSLVSASDPDMCQLTLAGKGPGSSLEPAFHAITGTNADQFDRSCKFCAV